MSMFLWGFLTASIFWIAITKLTDMLWGWKTGRNKRLRKFFDKERPDGFEFDFLEDPDPMRPDGEIILDGEVITR